MNLELLRIAQKFESYIRSKNVRFTSDGYPIIPDEAILREEPDDAVPFTAAGSVKDPGRTALTHYAYDEFLCRRLERIDDYIELYQGFMGVTGFDLSPRIEWNVQLQHFSLLLNRMTDAYLALHGVKILPNFRTGSTDTLGALNSYPANCYYMAGTLGCWKNDVGLESFYLRSKLLMARPKKLLFYGSLRAEYKEILDEFGTPWRIYPDFRKRSFNSGIDEG